MPRKGKENSSFIHSVNIYWEPARCQFFAFVGESMRAMRLEFKCLHKEQRPEPEWRTWSPKVKCSYVLLEEESLT